MNNWLRVSRRHPCPVCSRPTWCCYSRDGTAAICPRVPDGAKCYLGEAGYLHILSDTPSDSVYIPHQPDPEPTIDAPALASACHDAMSGQQLAEAAVSLGDGKNEAAWQKALLLLDMGWYASGAAYSFPMSNGTDVIGIRLRSLGDGKKWAIRGSKSGLFIPALQFNIGDTIYVTEGPTDTAALLTLGVNVLGRPFCRGGVEYIRNIVQQLQAEVVVVADCDGVGVDGAHSLADAVVASAASVRVIQPLRGKDARQWVNMGASREVLESVVDNQPLWKGK